MLMGIHPAIGPDLLAILCRMGHGDSLVLADAHFPAASCHPQVLRADAISIETLLEGILPLFPLDCYVDAPLAMMAAVPGDRLDPGVEEAYRVVIGRHAARGGFERPIVIERVERFAFYERAKRAFAIVQSGSTATYGNIIIQKGVVPVAPEYRRESL